jgi:hypothetical protein
VRRQNTEIRVATPSISDRVAFVVLEVEPETGERWTIDEATLKQVIKVVMQPEP